MATKAKKESLADQFAAAKARGEKLPERPSNDQPLELYGLYKQATEGDARGSRPGLFDLVGRAKWDAWAARKGTSADEARRLYVGLVDELARTIG